MTEKLKEYRNKRNFYRTDEPAGEDTESPSAAQQNGGDSREAQEKAAYVMHMHAASHDHFDLRLEQDGVLRSWALPKGPSLKPGEKRLAVEVEDHPVEYGTFEGVIPKGEYGGGTVMLWDRGHWRQVGKAKADKIDFELQGEKLTGHWTLVKMHGKPGARGKKDKGWLLIKRSDSGNTSLDPDDLSVATGRSMEEIARNESPHESAEPLDPKALSKAKPQPMPDAIAPQLATLVDSAPEGDNWLHEIKFDGYRLLARLDGGVVRLFTRNGKDWTHKFPDLADALTGVPAESAIIDGEITSLEEDGSTSFRKLQDSLGRKQGPARNERLVFQAFDLIYLDGYDLQGTPLLNRKETLARLLKPLLESGHRVRYSDHVVGQGREFHAQVCELGLEGMVSKRADAAYRPGRQSSWLKTKCTAQDEFVVGGYTKPSGARSGFGSLLLGAYHDGELNYAGRVGSGFDSRQLRDLHKQLKAKERDQSPFVNDVPDAAGVTWTKPELVVDVEFTERTQSGALRHPVFRGLREDKDPKEVTMNPALKNTETAPKPPARPAKSGRASDPVVAGVQLSHADRILYPEQGTTKLDLARYYEDVEDWIMPHLEGRPLSLLRCPEGWDQDCFFQKHPGATFGKGIPRIPIAEKKGGTSDFVYVSSLSDLVGLVQFGVLELHPWGSTIADVEAPDTMIFDLDPGPDLPWRNIATAAVSLRDRLQALGLNGFLQATGGKGLHIIVPVEPGLSWDEHKAFTHAVCKAHAQDDPQSFTTNMAKNKRHGKVFLDYLRNGRGNTGIARYSLRAREGAPVATPLRWDELTPTMRSNRYTINTLRRRLGALKTDPWDGYDDARVKITRKMRQQVGME